MDEVALGRAGFGFFEIGSNRGSRFQQLIDEASSARTSREVETKASDTTRECKRAVTDVLRAIRLHTRAHVHAESQHRTSEFARKRFEVGVRQRRTCATSLARGSQYLHL